MSPLIFAPTPLPHHIKGWLEVIPVFAVAIILHRLGEPRSVLVWMILGYLVGLAYGHGYWGGVIGAALGLASVRVRKRS